MGTSHRNALANSTRSAALIALLGVAFAPKASPENRTAPDAWIDDLSPVAASDWTYDRAAHLLERAGFGGTPEEIERLAAMTPEDAVRSLVHYEDIDNSHLPPFDESGIFDEAMDPFPKSRADAVRQGRERGESMGVKANTEGSRKLQPIVDKFFYGLRANALEDRRAGLWWADRMLATNRPLQEKLALFWHGHFATSDTKVRDYRKLLLQLDLFHEEGNGNFRDLLLGITKDPGMLAYLDNAENVKQHPNENFGRELMELFSMGVGNYTEADIREASRCFTGWTDDRLTFVIRPELHDDGEKTVLGKTGNFTGEDVIDILLAQDATAEFISNKIYRFFVREDLSPKTAARLAASFRKNDYELKPLLTTLFLSKDFYSGPSVATQIKSPVLLAVSTYKKLGLEKIPTIPDFHSATAGLGQFLFHPPNVAGWAEGRSWITPSSLMQRGNFVRSVLFPNVEGFRPPDRTMPGIYRRVGEKIAQGHNITEATAQGDSAFNKMADADEDYNTRYGGYIGYVQAYEVVKLIPRLPANFSLVAILKDSGAMTVEESVDYFLKRFLRTTLAQDDRQALVAYLEHRLDDKTIDFTRADLEEILRETVHLVMSAPEYQLS